MTREFSLNVNDRDYAVATDEERPLLDVLREELGLTGAKYGCGEGECGACTVLLDGVATRSCITTVGEAADGRIRTIEGLATGDPLHSVQQAFVDNQAMQCGYCVPGQILTAVALLDATPHPSREEIIAAMTGNLCRCCNYPNILAAIEAAADVSSAEAAR
jgi:aerobic-type carbon monoxide dehydrogenase small subunit (CoxS/CutS family)